MANRWELNEDDIEWQMDNRRSKEIMAQHPNAPVHKRPDVETVFERSAAVALMIINEVIFINSPWYDETLPEEAREFAALYVNCNDVFAWGCADAERLPAAGIEPLYRLWRKHGSFGPDLWCCIQRRELPQKLVADVMREAGIDLEAFQQEHGLRPNCYDGLSEALHDLEDEAALLTARNQWLLDNGYAEWVE